MALTVAEKSQLAGLISKADRLDLSEIRAYYMDQQSRLNRIDQCKFHRGQKVSFKSKHGYVIEGTVEKVMQKNIRVKSSKEVGLWKAGTQWTVSPSLLKAA